MFIILNVGVSQTHPHICGAVAFRFNSSARFQHFRACKEYFSMGRKNQMEHYFFFLHRNDPQRLLKNCVGGKTGRQVFVSHCM